MTVFSHEEAEHFGALIDHQLTDQIDRRILDIHISTPSHPVLTEAGPWVP